MFLINCCFGLCLKQETPPPPSALMGSLQLPGAAAAAVRASPSAAPPHPTALKYRGPQQTASAPAGTLGLELMSPMSASQALAAASSPSFAGATNSNPIGWAGSSGLNFRLLFVLSTFHVNLSRVPYQSRMLLTR
jgi:hypothetical protein